MTVINIPNTLTILRIVAIPIFVTMLMYNVPLGALIIFIFASITDILDGLIARLKNQQTELGRFLDPMADKFLLITSFVLFSIYNWIPPWLTICIVSRDLIVVVGWLMLYLVKHITIIKPSKLGKSAIAFQSILVTYVLIKINFNIFHQIQDFLIWITAAVTIASGLHYLYKGLLYSSSV